MSAELTCAETFRRLDDYLDRELSAEELRQVAGHLEECERCAAEFGVESELLEAIRERLRRIRAPEGLMARIRERLRE